MAKYNDLTVGQSEACINRMGGWDNFLRFIGGQGRVVFETILTRIYTVNVAVQPAFTTSKKYFEGSGIRWMGENFQAQFLDLAVPASNEVELAIHKLEKSSLDAPILAELGNKAETSVSQFKVFLAENRKSSEWFVFYLLGRDRRLWAVRADWHADCDGWHVDAYSVDNPGGWYADRRVVSRN